MSVGYILNIAGNKMGMNPSNAGERSVLLRFLNEAAIELYSQSDMAGSLIEQVFKVNGDQTIALPGYVGQLRAMREFNSHIPWHINQMRPRYNINNWKDMWRQWRIKGQSSLIRSVRNQGPLTITVPVVETPVITVTVAGPTATAANLTELVTLSTTSVTTTNNFNDVTLAIKNRVNNYDVSVTDMDGMVLTVIQNNLLEASYLVVDVSTLPWLNSTSTKQEHYAEVLYKKALPWLSNDGDEFPARGYDPILVNKMLQLWAEEQGKIDLAAAYDAKATRSLARKHEEENRATEDQVSFATNGHDELLTRLRTNRPGRHHASIYPYGIS